MPKSKKRKSTLKRKHPTTHMKSRLKKVKNKTRKNKLDKAMEANGALYVNIDGVYGKNIIKIKNLKIKEAIEMNLKYVMTVDISEGIIQIYDVSTGKVNKNKALGDKLSKIYYENRK